MNAIFRSFVHGAVLLFVCLLCGLLFFFFLILSHVNWVDPVIRHSTLFSHYAQSVVYEHSAINLIGTDSEICVIYYMCFTGQMQ